MSSLGTALILALAASSNLPIALAAQTVTVIVAPQGRLEYDPPYVRMGPGDKVLFIFQEGRHSVTQSEPDQPCVKLPVGSDTGLAPSSGVREEHSFTLYDNYNGDPRYFYSATHCQDGMVFAINPGPGALDAYRAAARNTGSNNVPPPSSPAPSPQPQPQPQPVPPTTTTVTVGGEVATIVTQPSPNPQQPPNGDASLGSPSPASNSGSSVTTGGAPSGTTISSSRPSATGTSSSSLPGVATDKPYEHFIGVGVDGLLTFSPARIQALVGDVVTFELRSENHSVAQSSFDNPCQPLVKEDGNIGFRSGVLTQGNRTAGEFLKFLRFSIRVNDTSPIYAFDGQSEHCKSGMVFAVNVKSEEFTSFQENARLGPSKARSEEGGAYAPGVSLISAVAVLALISPLLIL